jgi:phosphoglycerate dehydrogenase-like enzyme
LPGFDRMYAREDLCKAASEADFLLVVVPYSQETHRIVDASVFAAMPPHACLVNIARGGVVDEAAMIQALQEKRIAGAGLDVFETSPLPANSPLWDMENVFITPFIGGQSDQYEQNVLKIVEPNLRCFLAGDYAGMVNRVAF